MKIFLTVLIGLFFISCSSKEPGTPENTKTTETTEASQPQSTFTITHNDSEGSLPLFIYLEDKASPLSQQDKQQYLMAPESCVSVTREQFTNLNIQVIVAGEFKTLCDDSSNNKCQPGHYNVNNEKLYGELIDNYVLKPAKEPDTNCSDIKAWMDSNESNENNTLSANTTQSVPFTITHNDTDHDEPVYVYLQPKGSTTTTRPRLTPGECLSITREQFPHLQIQREIWSGAINPLCNQFSVKCPPNNYQIVDNKEGFFDDYKMKVVQQPNSNNCPNIKEWLQSKAG